MASLEKLLSEDRVWETLSSNIIGRTRSSNSGFSLICCPMCTSRGETPDHKYRCGIRYDASGIGINCFNCGFKARFKVGQPLNWGIKQFLQIIGVSNDEILRLHHWAWTINRMLQDDPDTQSIVDVIVQPEFVAKPLPEGSKSIRQWLDEDCSDPDFLNVATYLMSRGDDIISAMDYYWTPKKDNDLNRRLIVPCYVEGKTVGWTARSAVNSVTPKYLNETPPGLLFNSDAISKRERDYLIIVEGIFDAIAIDCVSLLGVSLSKQQALWIKSSEQIKIAVPDRDDSGMEMIEIALENNWLVACPGIGLEPWWEPHIKDVADAVKEYGRLWTLRSIIASATRDKFKIALWKKVYAKKAQRRFKTN